MNPSQVMNGSPRTNRRAAAGYQPVGGSTTDDRKIPAHVAAILIGAGILLIALDKAKFKMVVGVS